MALSLSYCENWNFRNQCKSTDNVDIKNLDFIYKEKHKQTKKKPKKKDLQMGIWTQTL